MWLESIRVSLWKGNSLTKKGAGHVSCTFMHASSNVQLRPSMKNPNDLEYPHVADSPTCLPALPELGTGRTKSKATSISRTSLCWSVEVMATSSRSSPTSLRSAGITSWISVPEWLYVYWDPMYSMSWRHVFQWHVHTRTTIGFWQQHVPLSHFLPEIEMKPAISNISRTWMFSWASESVNTESANSCCQIIVVWNKLPARRTKTIEKLHKRWDIQGTCNELLYHKMSTWHALDHPRTYWVPGLQNLREKKMHPMMWCRPFLAARGQCPMLA